MTLRRAVYQGLVALPFLGIGLLMIQARTFKSHFEPVHYDAEQHSTVLAYSGPVAFVHSFAGTESEFDDELLDKGVAVWKSEYREGRLRDYLPRHTDEMTESTVREEIRSAKMHLVIGLTHRADSKIENGQYADATLDLLDAMEIAAIGKYSDFPTLEQAARTQSRLLDRLIQIEPNLGGAHKGEVHQRMLYLRRQQRNPTFILKAIRNSEVNFVRQSSGEAAAQEALRDFQSLILIEGIDELAEAVEDPRRYKNQRVYLLAIGLKSALRYEIKYRDKLAELTHQISSSRYDN